MADKFFIQDHGDAVWHDGQPWEFVETSNSDVPDATLDAIDGDTAFPGPPQIFTVADAQGTSQYSAAEQLLAEQSHSGALVDTDENWATLIATTAVAGVLRVWTESGNAATVRINGIEVSGDAGDSFADAKPINVEAGQLVEVKLAAAQVADVSYILIPFVYTPPA